MHDHHWVILDAGDFAHWHAAIEFVREDDGEGGKDLKTDAALLIDEFQLILIEGIGRRANAQRIQRDIALIVAAGRALQFDADCALHDIKGGRLHTLIPARTRLMIYSRRQV